MTTATRTAHRERKGDEDASGTPSPWLPWAPRRLSWWVGVLYVLGSALFIVGAVASLWAELPDVLAPTAYFVGSLVFSGGVYAQLLEAINARKRIGDPGADGRLRLFAWQPRRLSWLIAALFLLGTGLFDTETGIALADELGLLSVSLPLGYVSVGASVVFLIAACLQVAQSCPGRICVRPGDLGWWSSALSLLGAIGFVVGALFGLQVIGLSSSGEPLVVALAYLMGSAVFLVGSYLMLPESFSGSSD